MIALATVESNNYKRRTICKEVFEKLKRRNPNEPEFHQAVKEILDSLIPVFDKHPKYMEEGILKESLNLKE